jgi:hypothetical protein
MFTEPLVVTVSGAAKNLARIGSSDLKGVFNNTASGLRATISHTSGKRDRHIVRLDFNKLVPDAFTEGINRNVSMSVQLSVDAPTVGFTVAEIEANTQAVIDKLDEVGVLTKIINWES